MDKQKCEIYKEALEKYGVGAQIGLFADRVLLERVDDSKYCHNWILEFWVDYGWLLGTILATIVLKESIFASIKRMNTSLSEFAWVR